MNFVNNSLGFTRIKPHKIAHSVQKRVWGWVINTKRLVMLNCKGCSKTIGQNWAFVLYPKVFAVGIKQSKHWTAF